MTEWEHRPVEIANLLNPAFAALLVHEAVRNYSQVSEASTPIALVFLALPIALHRGTREVLPGSTVAKMRPWLDEHPSARIGFAARVRCLRQFVREGLLLASQAQLVGVGTDGGLRPMRKTKLSIPQSWREGTDTVDCWKAVGFVARWFSATAGPTTLFALWGVKP